MLRVVEDLVRRPFLDDLAVLHDEQVARHRADDLQVVADEEVSEVVLALQVAQQVDVNTLPQVTQSRNSINFQQAQEDELRAATEATIV